jgi:hypothetical protein
MVKSSIAHWGDIAWLALHLIRNRHSGHHIAAGCIRLFAGRQNRADIVAGMAGFAFGQVTVIKIEVPGKSRVVQCRAIRSSAATTNQSATANTIKFFDDGSNFANWLSGLAAKSTS